MKGLLEMIVIRPSIVNVSNSSSVWNNASIWNNASVSNNVSVSNNSVWNNASAGATDTGAGNGESKTNISGYQNNTQLYSTLNKYEVIRQDIGENRQNNVGLALAISAISVFAFIVNLLN